MKQTRLYEVVVGEKYDDYGSSCHIATVRIKSGSAEMAVKRALGKVENEIESGPLCILTVECVHFFWLEE